MDNRKHVESIRDELVKIYNGELIATDDDCNYYDGIEPGDAISLMYGYIEKGNTTVSFYITVSGYPHRGYNGYTLKEAKKRYCEEFKLDIDNIDFDDWRK